MNEQAANLMQTRDRERRGNLLAAKLLASVVLMAAVIGCVWCA